MNSMYTYTYNWQMQPMINWKPNSKTLSVPINARPNTNGVWIIEKPGGINEEDGNAFLPRPIKHWRKQLVPDSIRGGTKSTNVISLLEQKTSSQNIDNKECCNDIDCKQDVNGEECYDVNATKIISNISTEKFNNYFCDDKNGGCQVITYDDVFYDCQNGPIGKRLCCNPEKNLIRAAELTTPINNNYTNTSAYLQSRCKTYRQRLSYYHAPDCVYYSPEGIALYPNDEPNGPQVFLKTDCDINCYNKCPSKFISQINTKTIYKPSNRDFAVEGASSGGSRLLKLKNDTINRNGASTNNAWGLVSTNYGFYGIEGQQGSYFVKLKPSAPQCFAPKGSHTRCFTTMTSNIGKNKIHGRIANFYK